MVRPGRAFLRNLIDAATSVSELDHWVHLNQRARADLAWWNTFLKVWNGTSVSPPPEPSWYIVSDASGSWGCGAFHGNRWFQPEEWAKNISIAPKELVPIVVATVLWGAHWAGGHVRFLCDNAAVVMAVNRGSARDPSLSHLFRILALVTAILGIHTTAKHLPGTQNTSADALSRNKLPLFFSLNPQASPVSSHCTPRTTVTGVQHSATVDIAELGASVELFLHNCIAPTTRAAYRSAQRRYERFCDKYGVSPLYIPTTGGNIMQLCSVFSEGGPQISYNQGIPLRNTVPTDTDIVRQPLSRWQHAPLGICPGRYQEG